MSYRKPSTCHPEFPDEGFGLCRRCYGRAWYKKNKARSMAHKAAWRKSHPEAMKRIYRAARLKKKYGITTEQYNNLGEQQNWKCSICTSVQKDALVIDHSHATGKIRSLLCQRCNLGLGQFLDNPATLEQAVVYLKTYEKTQGLSPGH